MKFSCLLILAFAIPLAAQRVDTSIRVKRSSDWNASARDGFCVFKVQVDDEADFSLNGDTLTVISTRGPARDLGTECTSYMPARDESVRLGRLTRGRGDVKLHDSPSTRNNWSALIRIVDSPSGPDDYEFRLEWGRTDGRNSDSGSGGGSSASKNSGGEYDERDLSRWSTKDLRSEIENIYSKLGLRRPSSDDVDDFIDLIRNKNYTFKQVRSDLQKKK